MSKLTEIKSKICQLGAAEFQEFCDAYLVRKNGCGSILELGMKSGTLKTTIGNPDTYFRTNLGKYVFVAYTTQESNLDQKIRDDIEKCLDESKTGVSITDIDEIICCHTSSTLSAGVDQQLHTLCNRNNISLQLYGVDRIANEVYARYKHLSRDFLGISIDTNQIFEKNDFVHTYDANEMAAPLNMQFLFREEEVSKVTTGIKGNRVVAICGKAGAGKTRLALEVAERFSKEYSYRLLCIKSNNLAIVEDLSGYIENSGRYLLFVDDANELVGLKYVLEYINKEQQGYDVKILLTVRDYARQKIMRDISDYIVPCVIELSRFSDDEIKKILDKNMDIRNDDYVSQIVKIAEGNPRMAYMAGKLAIEKQSLSAIHDVTQLYENYYNKYIENATITTDRKLCISTGILALLNVIRMDNLQHLSALFQTVGITSEEFVENLSVLSEMELIEIKYDKVAKFTDQCLANYMIYYTFFKKRFFPFSVILEVGFKNFRNGIIKALNTLMNIFGSNDVERYMSNEIGIVWDKFAQEGGTLFEEFVKVFHVFKPEDALLYAQEEIQKVDKTEIELCSMDFEKQNYNISNRILDLLVGYRYHNLLPETLELFVQYANKDQEKIGECFAWFKEFYSVDKDSHHYNYYTEGKVAEVLTPHSEDNETFTALYIEIAGHLLSLLFEPVEAEGKNTIRLYRIPILCNVHSQQYRKILWKKLKELCSNKRNQKHILHVLDKYATKRDELQAEMVLFDKIYIIDIVKKLRMISAVQKGKVCQTLLKLWQEAGDNDSAVFEELFKDKQWEVYTLLEDNWWNEELTYEEHQNERKNRIESYALKLKDEQIVEFVNIVNQIVQDNEENDNWQINNGLEIFFEVFCNNAIRTEKAINVYIKYGTALDISPVVVMKKAYEQGIAEKIYQITEQFDFSQKNQWQFSFFDIMPKEEVDENKYKMLIDFLKSNTDGAIKSSPFRRLRFLDKFETEFPGTYCLASKIILQKREYNEFITRIYFELLFHEGIYTPEELKVFYSTDLELLKEIYFWILQNGHLVDYKGKFISSFIEWDIEWLKRYVDYFYEYLDKQEDEGRRTFSFWESDKYLEIFDYLFYRCSEVDCLKQWRFNNAFKFILCHGKDAVIKERQHEWLLHIVSENCYTPYIKSIFEVIAELGNDVRRECIGLFLSINKDYETFKNLSIESGHWSGWGSLIPTMQRRIDFLKSILPLTTGLDLLKHRRLINDYIEMWENRIEREQIQEIMEETYM